MTLYDLRRRLADLQRPEPGEPPTTQRIFVDRKSHIRAKCSQGCPGVASWGAQIVTKARR